jgi:transcription termination factor NusB
MNPIELPKVIKSENISTYINGLLNKVTNYFEYEIISTYINGLLNKVTSTSLVI